MSSRTCGSCGAEVGANDITCSNCEALLAAYEPPVGSSSPTDIATQPVDMKEIPVPAPVVDSIDMPEIPQAVPEPGSGPLIPAPAETPIPDSATTSPTAERLEAFREERTERPSYKLPQQSPIARAMEKTKAAVDATPQPTSEAEREAIASIMDSAEKILEERQDELNVPEAYREDVELEELGEFDPDDDDEPDASGGTSASQPTPRPKPKPKPEPREKRRPPASESTAVQRVRAQAKKGWYEENQRQTSRIKRSNQSESGKRATKRHPDRPSLPESQREQQSQSIGTIALYGFIGLIVLIVVGRFMPGTLIVPVIVIGMVWFVSSLSKSTGRKTTSMPRQRIPR